MANPLDVPELKYIIVNLLDLKSIGRLIQVGWDYKCFIQDMPIYEELMICLNTRGKIYDPCRSFNIRITMEQIFVYACANACWRIIHNIIRHANIETKVLDIAFSCACEGNHFDVIKFLIQKGCKIYIHNNSAFQKACENGQADLVKLFVENGANIDVKDNYALKIACESGYTDVVKYLVEKGANIHAEYDYGLR